MEEDVSGRESEASGSRIERETEKESTEAGPTERETEGVVMPAEVEIECEEPDEDEVVSIEAETPEEDIQSRETGPAEKQGESRGAEPDEEDLQTFNYFARPQSKDLSLFFQYHPQQTPRRVLPNIFHSRDGINRKWL